MRTLHLLPIALFLLTPRAWAEPAVDLPGADDDLPEAGGDPDADLPEAGEDPGDGSLPDDDALEDLPDEPEVPAGYLSVVIEGEFKEYRLKGPDGNFYTTGKLAPGKYVLGVRYDEATDWERYTLTLNDGREMRVDCDAAKRDCKVRERDWKR